MSGERVIPERDVALWAAALVRIENRAVELDPSFTSEDRPLFAWSWRAAILEEMQRWQPAPAVAE